MGYNELPTGWQEVPLGNLTTEKSDRVSRNKSVTVLSSTKHFGLVPSDEFFKNRTIYSSDTSNYKILHKGWFAYATNHLAEGSIGLYFGNSAACVSPIYTVFSCGDEVFPEYLFRLLKSPAIINLYREHEQASVDRRGAVRYRDFSKIVVRLPPTIEQHRIAEILNTVDEAIRRTEQVIEKLQQIKQGLLHDLLTCGIDDNGELRPSPDEAPHLYKDSPLGLIPASWSIYRFGDMVSTLYRYPSYYGIKYVEQGVAEIRGELVLDDGSLTDDPSAYRRVAESTADQFIRVRVKPGDFVMTVRGTVGKIAQVPKWLEGAVITANLIRIGLTQGIVDVCWMKHYFLSNRWRENLDLACSATTISTIQVPAMSSIMLAVPEFGEQSCGAEVLNGIQNRIDLEIRSHIKLRTLKKGLMDDLLTGRVRVNVSEGEC